MYSCQNQTKKTDKRQTKSDSFSERSSKVMFQEVMVWGLALVFETLKVCTFGYPVVVLLTSHLFSTL